MTVMLLALSVGMATLIALRPLRRWRDWQFAILFGACIVGLSMSMHTQPAGYVGAFAAGTTAVVMMVLSFRARTALAALVFAPPAVLFIAAMVKEIQRDGRAGVGLFDAGIDDFLISVAVIFIVSFALLLCRRLLEQSPI